jgi:hypothetical protein
MEPQIRNIELQETVPVSDHKTTAELELEQLEGRLRTVQLSLEILTGACATLPDSSGDDNGHSDEGKRCFVAA